MFVCVSWVLKTIKEILKFSFRAAQTPHCTDFKYNIYLKIYAIGNSYISKFNHYLYI